MVADADRHPFASVVIPVYNDSDRLKLCLHALEQQSYPSDRYEVIVVDNGCDLAVSSLVQAFSHARCVVEPQPGVSRARATGLTQVQGELIAFTDSDCIPDREWLRRGVEFCNSHPTCGVAGGAIEVFARDPSRPSVAESLSVAMHLKQERFISGGGWAVLANAFVPRAVIERVGAMKPELFASGEVEWCRRIGAAGYAVLFVPAAIVRHPARTSIRQLYERTLRLEQAWSTLRMKADVGRGWQHWLGQYIRHPLSAIYTDVFCNPRLSRGRRVQVAALSCFLAVVRCAAYMALRVGVRWDVRARWS